jgi:hypothetical protein
MDVELHYVASHALSTGTKAVKTSNNFHQRMTKIMTVKGYRVGVYGIADGSSLSHAGTGNNTHSGSKDELPEIA